MGDPHFLVAASSPMPSRRSRCALAHRASDYDGSIHVGCHSFAWRVDDARRRLTAVRMDLQLNAKSALQCGSIHKHWYQLRMTSAGMLRAQLPHGICSCPWIRCERGSIDLCMLSLHRERFVTISRERLRVGRADRCWCQWHGWELCRPMGVH